MIGVARYKLFASNRLSTHKNYLQRVVYRLKSTIVFLLKWRIVRVALHIAVRLFAPRHRIGVAAIVMDEQKGVLLLNHVFHPTIPWGVPGGWLDVGEAPLEGAMRELREETGIEAAGGTLILMRRDRYPDHLAIAYLMEVKTEITPSDLKLSKEIISAAWFELSDIPHLTPFNYDAVLTAAEQIQQKYN